MTIHDKLKEVFSMTTPNESADNQSPDNQEIKPDDRRVIGKIIKTSSDPEKGGWGFITSKDIPFTRIFFHWTSLKQDTLKFTELTNGMQVEFTPIEVIGKGWRAIKIKVVE